MSQEIVPEWKRKLRELEALLKGVWHDIMRHEDMIHDLDKRVEKLEEGDIDEGS